jgi:hypothetical protein
MNTLSHGIINFIVAYALGFTPAQIFIVVLAGTLIDIDHLLYYIGKRPSLLKTPFRLYKITVRHWRWYQARLFFFHTIEFNLFILVLSIFSPVFLYISLGMIIHLLADVYDYLIHLRSFVWLKHWFITYYVLRYVHKKAKQTKKQLAKTRRNIKKKLSRK